MPTFIAGLEILDDVASNRHIWTRPSRVESRRGSTRLVRSAHRARPSRDFGIVFGTLFVFEKLLEDGEDLSGIHLVEVLIGNALVGATC